jgi:beta-phosphoglucomutase
MIQSILFDFNGVIIDDEPLWMRAYTDALKEQNIPLTEEQYFEMLGMDDRTFVSTAFEQAGRPLDEATMRAVIESAAQKHRALVGDNPPLFPGVETFVIAAAREFTIGIVSMASRAEIDYILERANLNGLFSVIVSAENVSACKPDPECYRRAFLLADDARRHHGSNKSHRISMSPEECLVIEDSPPGILSARRAGLRTLGVTHTVSEAALRSAGAEVVTHNLADWTTDSVRYVFT